MTIDSFLALGVSTTLVKLVVSVAIENKFRSRIIKEAQDMETRFEA